MGNRYNFNAYGVTLNLADGRSVVLNAGSGMTIFPSGDLITFSAQPNPNAVINALTPWQPPVISNVNAPKNSVYFSSDANKLVYKDAAGVVNVLY